MVWISQKTRNESAKQDRKNEDAPAVLGPYEIYERGEERPRE
jgi:hypothetical protein